MAKKRKFNPTLEDRFTDPEQLKRMNDHLYSRKPLLEAGGPFAEMLQTMVNAALVGEARGHIVATACPRLQGNKRLQTLLAPARRRP